jgi:adenine deaminase
MEKKVINGKFLDIHREEIYPVDIHIEDGIISDIVRVEKAEDQFISPGLIDAHIHIESSMLIPSRFASEAIKHGTIATVSDPHEIANVCGKEGVEYMIEDSKKVPFHFYFGAPSCVPATGFETSGAVLNSDDVFELLKNPDIHYLSEMMNYPGVIHKDEEVLTKIRHAHELGMKVDGHAPGLRGADLESYVKAGISTDHESFTLDEAREKIALGMKVIIREGSAAKNYEALKPIIREFPEMVMFCSDDKHPDDLLKGHINKLLKRALNDGFYFWDVLKAATINPYKHYRLNHGMLNIGDKADFVIFKDIEEFDVSEVYISGAPVFQNDCVLFKMPDAKRINHFNSYEIKPEDLRSEVPSDNLRVIEARDGELITGTYNYKIGEDRKNFESSTDDDILKIAVVNRYSKAEPGIAWIKNFGLKKGAIASTVAHDSHNIIAVGTSNENLSEVINELMRLKGGIAVYDEKDMHSLSLPVGGLMSDRSASEVGPEYEKLDLLSKKLGSQLKAPFMTLSFMALLVIPELKLSDKGLFNGIDFTFESLDASV